jgi:hypothetical protein
VTAPSLPPWLLDLPGEDLEFLRRFVLASGSLKALAQEYGVSYPTIRLRLDRVIARVRTSETLRDTDPMTRKIRHLIAEGGLDPAIGRQLLETYAQLRTEPADVHALV